MKKDYNEAELEIMEFLVNNVLTDDSDPSGEGEGGEI